MFKDSVCHVILYKGNASLAQGTVVNSYLKKKSNYCHIRLTVYIWLPVTFSVSQNKKRSFRTFVENLHKLFSQCLIVHQKRSTVEPSKIGKKVLKRCIEVDGEYFERM